MSDTSRFSTPSGALSLPGLSRRAQSALWPAVALALAMHLGLAQMRALRDQQQTAKPLTTQFIKRQPRLTKPLELKKRPQPRRRTVQRQMVAVKARVGRADASSRFVPTQVIQGFSRPRAQVARTAALQDATVEPRALAEAIYGTREPKQSVDLSLELLDIQALHTGKYHALVVQDPGDRRNIRGFCRLGVIYSDNMYGQVWPSFEELIRPAFFRLVDAMNKYTSIETDIFGKITLESAELSKTPWVYFMAFFGFELSDGELRGLGKYMTSGGFVFADTYWVHSQWRVGAQAVAVNVAKAFELAGVKGSAFEVLPNSHPVYHCYFDFDGPPTGAGGGGKSGDEPDYLEGIEVDGRLCVILSKKAYYGPWSHYGTDKYGGSYKYLNPERAFQFGVNLIVFALTQEGSITNRVMDAVSR